MQTSDIRRLFEALEEIVHAPGDWQSKRDAIEGWAAEESTNHANNLEEFLAWFPEPVGDEESTLAANLDAAIEAAEHIAVVGNAIRAEEIAPIRRAYEDLIGWRKQ